MAWRNSLSPKRIPYVYIKCCHAEGQKICFECMTCNYHGLVQKIELFQKLPKSALHCACSLTSQLNNGSVISVRLELNLITKPNFLILLLKTKRWSSTMCIQIILIIFPSWLGRGCALGHASYSKMYLSAAKHLAWTCNDEDCSSTHFLKGLLYFLTFTERFYFSRFYFDWVKQSKTRFYFNRVSKNQAAIHHLCAKGMKGKDKG